jgi:hypothetical protein
MKSEVKGTATSKRLGNTGLDLPTYLSSLLSEQPDSVLGIMNRLLHGRSVVQILARARDVSLLKHAQTANGVHPASCSVGSGRFILCGYSGWSVKLTIHLHLAPKLRMRHNIYITVSPACQLHLFTLPHGSVLYVIIVFSGFFETTKRRERGLCFLPVKQLATFYVCCIACPTNRPRSSWLMAYIYVCGYVASRRQHELCKAADTTGM